MLLDYIRLFSTGMNILNMDISEFEKDRDHRESILIYLIKYLLDTIINMNLRKNISSV